MKVQWVFRSYSTTSSKASGFPLTLSIFRGSHPTFFEPASTTRWRFSESFAPIPLPAQLEWWQSGFPLISTIFRVQSSHWITQEIKKKLLFSFPTLFSFCPMMTSLKETLWGRGGAPRLDATRCYSPWPAVTRRDPPRLAIERKSTWKSNSPTSSSFFSFFSSSRADPEIRFHLRFHFEQVFPCHFSLLFWREKRVFLSPVSVFNCACLPSCLPSFLAPAHPPAWLVCTNRT